MGNIRTFDRFLRLVLGIAALQLGYFWLASPWSSLAYAVALVLFVTAAFRFCPLYRVLGIAPVAAGKTIGGLGLAITAIVLAALVGGGSYASAFFTRKIFLEDFNAMNHFYKQTLFLTGKAQREEAVANLNQLKPALAAFTAKYTAYRPYDIKGDGQFPSDLSAVAKIISDVEPLVTTGDLHQAHLDLEKVRPIFQDVFKRNGFSMLAVALVDFHDAMELVLDAANAKDTAKIAELYPAVSDKLKVVEAEANDDEIKAIRAALDDVLATAQTTQLDALPAKGETLKTSFVKVYLKRG
jgi:hypothetical protein